MAQYTPLPSVGRARPRNLRLADLYIRQGDAQADAELRAGAIKAQLFGDLGKTISQTGSAIVQAPQMAREQAAAETERAQRSKMAGMQLGEAERSINDRENFDLAMTAGTRQKTLDALKDRPELYEKAQGHYAKIDASMKSLLESAAGGIADFGYTPEAANAALDDLVEQGFDANKLKPYREAFKSPEQIKTIVDRMLGVTPAVPKTREIKVTNPDGTETIQLVKDEPGQTFTSTPPDKPDTRPIEQQIADALAKGDQATVDRLTKAAKLTSDARRPPKEPKDTAAADAERKRMVAAVLANPSLWDSLTPTVKGDLAADLAGAGFDGFGRRLSDAAIKQMSDSKGAIQSLRDLRVTLQDNEQYIGPVAGLQALNPYSDARKAQAKINLVRQRVGKALEGGVLRKEDEEKYKTILSTLTDTPDTAIFKVDNLIETLENDLAAFADEQRSAGRRMPSQKKDSGGAGRVYYDENGNPIKKP